MKMQFGGRGKLKHGKYDVHWQYKACICVTNSLRHRLFLLSAVWDFISGTFVSICFFNACTRAVSIKAPAHMLDWVGFLGGKILKSSLVFFQ